MRIERRHAWDLTPTEAVALQRRLREEVVADRPIDLGSVRLVAGVDVSVKSERSRAAVVVATFPGFEVVETVTALAPTPFPYVPGLLSFREGPVLEEAFGKLQAEPDVFLFDGMGTAHPRRIGIASHMGLWLQRPTIGCGKTRLCGRNGPLSEEKGAHVPLVDRGETIGAVVRTRTGKHPMFISPGHLADIPTSVALVLACAPKYRLPEPIRLAHRAAGDF
ncbi:MULTISPECIES: deoxyribonuclease V [Methylobacterium]|uniref:Endonuclease V n=1 Tax=Methylobacterium jeotgali TaxID=381630 RepID=A0ABQ4SPT8_9HYPH|nr:MULTISPECIES: deoxyribonuclease V [Methylobacterium]PIU06986.1 MAG: endonuclease V [Methylobacterium sp. CG09_land_8_20_14_0_10_71_15]PIU13488.1 MAG: endonuclease V [Methylobacterium sp. CG08_land_8_20_14_0_20_71_15]GBU19927.1 endonuclease V [Methylobacterium sp.]GJE05097.1 Endonuclease V [Methylobacterium jeotgali]